MTYICPKGHESTDSDYCSECGALIGQSTVVNLDPPQDSSQATKSQAESGGQEVCPDCGTLRVMDARFCEVCRHDFQSNKTGEAEVIIASKQSVKFPEEEKVSGEPSSDAVDASKVVDTLETVHEAVPQKLNLLITVDKEKASAWEGESVIKPDTVDRVFPLDLDENLVGRRSKNKGIYPEIEISDPGVSHRHLKFLRDKDGSFVVLELGSSNGTEINGGVLEPGVNTPVKAGDELAIGIWTLLKIVER